MVRTVVDDLAVAADALKLQRLLDSTPVDVVRDAMVHLLASLEMHEPIHRVVPSEQEQAGEPGE